MTLLPVLIGVGVAAAIAFMFWAIWWESRPTSRRPDDG